MNSEKRKQLKLRVAKHPQIIPLRIAIAEAAKKLPEMLPPADDKEQRNRETVIRVFLGGKMPKRIVALHRAHYSVRPCIGGAVFTAAVFPAPGGAENRKMCVTMCRLADAITHHFRNSRMRGRIEYNFDSAQARVDSEFFRNEFKQLADILVECGVPVTGNPIHGASSLEREIKFDEYKALEAQAHDAVSRLVLLDAKVNKLFETLDSALVYLATVDARIKALEDRTLFLPQQDCGTVKPPSLEPETGTATPLPSLPSQF